MTNFAIDYGLEPATEYSHPRFCWVDLETTGLDRDDVILEFGMVVSDAEGHVFPDSAYSQVIWESSDHFARRFNNMDSFVHDMHNNSGLLDELSHGNTKSINVVQNEALAVLKDMNIDQDQLYLAGSSVHFDERFMLRYMPQFVHYLSYRQVNVSTLKILAQELHPDLYNSIQAALEPQKLHRSLPDLADSIHEYEGYCDNFLYL